MFEVERGHGRTLWTRRRIEDTPPSIVDPVINVLDDAHGSHRVTQKKIVTMCFPGKYPENKLYMQSLMVDGTPFLVGMY